VPPKKDKRAAQGPPTISSYVLKTIRDGILTGRYPLGARLDQQALAEELGVSVIPVREGLRQLEAEGLVQIYPRRGAYVAEPSVGEFQEIYLIRQVLEELATQLAVPNLSPQVLDLLGNVIQQMEEAIASQDLATLPELDRKFRFTLYGASLRPILLGMLSSLWDRASLYQRLVTHLPDRASQVLAEYKKIYAACRAGDAIAAGQAVREYIHQAAEEILEKLEADQL
jgi:DNA-binding GntR family transcriptional regulator